MPQIEGVDMATGTECGFFTPTNPNNAIGATRKNFCTGVTDKISRHDFEPKQKNPPPRVRQLQELTNVKGHPLVDVYMAIGNVKFAQPRDYFDLQICPVYVIGIQNGTNYPATAEGVGVGKTGREKKDFGDFVLFDDNEIYKFIGLMFANGLNPRPKFESWFKNPMSCPMFASNFVKGVFDKRVHGVTIPGRRRWQHLC